jgi:hypothetical protein
MTTTELSANLAERPAAAAASRALATARAAGDVVPGFGTAAGWDLLQRQARALAAAEGMVPPQYVGNIPSCIIACDIAARMRLSPLTVVANLNIINGRPGWTTQYLIACFNACGRFTSLRYQRAPEQCRSWAIELATRERLEGPLITMKMARAEGWMSRKGSKWLTMPEHMLDLRAAAFFIRQTAPELALGLRTAEEQEDMGVVGEARVMERPQRIRDILEAEGVVLPGPDAANNGDSASRDPTPAEPTPEPDSTVGHVEPGPDTEPAGEASESPPFTTESEARAVAAREGDAPGELLDSAPVESSPARASGTRFDVSAFRRRVARCADLSILQLMSAELDALPEGGSKSVCADALAQRSAELVDLQRGEPNPS